MEEMPHPHTSYNKQVGGEGVQAEVPTLVGNWQEERELKAVTGIARYQVRQWTLQLSGLARSRAPRRSSFLPVWVPPCSQ